MLMARNWVVVVALVVVLAVHASALAEAQAPPQYAAVERFVAMVNDGAKAQLRLMFSRGVTYAEHGLYWHEVHGTAALPELYALIDAGVRWEVELHAAVSGGDVIVTRERVWVEGSAEALTPLRSTGVYVVDGDRILSITRVLDVDQRHELLGEALVGTWGVELEPTWIEHDAEGGFSWWYLPDGSERAAIDSGRSTVERDLWTIVRDEGTRVCEPGDTVVFRLRFTTPDIMVLTLVEDTCRRWYGLADYRMLRALD